MFNLVYRKVGKFFGLCGNFNGFVQDDLWFCDNVMVNDDVEFGYDWKDDDDCFCLVFFDFCLLNLFC